MRYIKSNSGLGHQEYVYLMPLKTEGQHKHLVLNTIGVYKAGTVEDIEPWESDGMVSKEDVLSVSEIDVQLLTLLEKSQN